MLPIDDQQVLQLAAIPGRRQPSSVRVGNCRRRLTCTSTDLPSESPEMEHDLQVSRKCYKISRNLGNLILIFFCQKKAFGDFGVNPRYADHRDMKLAPVDARTMIAS